LSERSKPFPTCWAGYLRDALPVRMKENEMLLTIIIIALAVIGLLALLGRGRFWGARR